MRQTHPMWLGVGVGIGVLVLGLGLGLGACSPDIVPGAYLCGPDQSCPEDQVCDGVDNLCVAPGGAQPLICTSGEAQPRFVTGCATVAPSFGSISVTVPHANGCAPLGDAEDWYQFDVPANCGPTVASIRLSFPIAFEQFALRLGAQPSIEGDSAMCGVDSAPDDGAMQLCLKQSVTAGTHYTVRVARSGVGNCDGQCGYNRYTLTLQLGTP